MRQTAELDGGQEGEKAAERKFGGRAKEKQMALSKEMNPVKTEQPMGQREAAWESRVPEIAAESNREQWEEEMAE